MALASGTRLGAYQVEAPLGAGGMGEVYRARDTKLGREVALKVLPDAFAQDPERLARFEREARTLAALNHPGIAQIYGVEESHDVRALVMELVPGRTLDEMLRASPIGVVEALAIARQIAEALEAAHDAGVIHRDLKPANIKIRTDGVVKVLDFGLAKAMDLEADGARGGPYAHSPTMTSPAMTRMGMILGTAAYMSPEQAKGAGVDKRADIWAFGGVLYEMLAGRRLFGGDTVSETVAAVLRDNIDLGRLPVATPPGVRRLLSRCLDRDPRTRLRDIGEARVLLTTPDAESTAPLATDPTSTSLRRWTAAVAWLVVGLIVGAGSLWIIRDRLGASDDRAARATSLRRLTELPGPEIQPDMSPDGRQILYASAAAGNWDIYLLRVGGARAINLTAGSPAGDSQARFSPNGDHIVFRSERDGGGLFVMGATGESVRRLTREGYDPAWSPDGRSIAYSMEAVDDPYNRRLMVPLWVVDVATGKTTRLVEADAVQPAWSPNGKRIAYWANTTGGQRDIWTVAASGGKPVAVTNDAATDWSPEWSHDGRWLYFSSDRDGGAMNLWRVRLDPETGGRQGEPEQVTNGVRGLGYARFSADGRSLIVMGYDRTFDLIVADFDPVNPDRITPRVTMRNQSLNWCDPSPDGSWLACSSRGAREDLVLLRADGAETRRLMDDQHKDRLVYWSPDGQALAFISTRTGKWESWAVQVDGSDLRPLTQLGGDAGTGVWSPDGRRMLVASILADTTWILDTSQIATGASATVVKSAPKGFDSPSWSPAGDLIAGKAEDSAGTPVAGVLNLATGVWRSWNAPLDYRSQAGGWLPDSRRFLMQAPGGLLLIDAVTGEWRVLLPGSMGDRYRLSRDGRTLLIERQVFDSDVWLMQSRDE